MPPTHRLDDPTLARKLILDELFDLSLYQRLAPLCTGRTQQVLQELSAVERQHYTFWQHFFDLRLASLDLGRRLKLWVLLLACRLFGRHAVHLVLEAIEVYGVRKYLALGERSRGTPLGEALHVVLAEELQHEDALVAALAERQLDPEKVRHLLLGFNDGLVEILGAVSGFFGAFDNALSVLLAAVTVAVAGALAPQPTVTVEAGAIWMQVYDAVTTQAGRYVQGGGCTTVGVAGLIQSGGFGSFSKHYGLAAADLLETDRVAGRGGEERRGGGACPVIPSLAGAGPAHPARHPPGC